METILVNYYKFRMKLNDTILLISLCINFLIIGIIFFFHDIDWLSIFTSLLLFSFGLFLSTFKFNQKNHNSKSIQPVSNENFEKLLKQTEYINFSQMISQKKGKLLECILEGINRCLSKDIQDSDELLEFIKNIYFCLNLNNISVFLENSNSFINVSNYGYFDVYEYNELDYPTIFNKLKNNEIFTSIIDLTHNEQQNFNDRDIKSILFSPIFNKNKFIGFMALESRNKKYFWDNTTINSIKNTTNILGNFCSF